MEKSQITNTVVMVSPLHFGFNPETAESNPFQNKLGESEDLVQERASEEFKGMVKVLRDKGIQVLVLESLKDFVTPDSVFPNNWFSHHSDGKLVVYPMLAPNRRVERQVLELKQLLETAQVPVTEVLDLTSDEKEGLFLEGTGSLVLDRENKVVFAMESPRTTKVEFDKWCNLMGYQGIFFHAYDEKSFPIYHTNVTMNIGSKFVVICLESITDEGERGLVEGKLKDLGKEIIEISKEQMGSFCGNVLELLSRDGSSKIVMSETAFAGFKSMQIGTLSKFGEIIQIKIPTIETVGGGSARCMLAEVFNSKFKVQS